MTAIGREAERPHLNIERSLQVSFVRTISIDGFEA